MICKNCGTQCTGTYCSHCGHALVAEEPPKPAPVVTTTPANKPTEAETPTAQKQPPEKQPPKKQPPKKQEDKQSQNRPLDFKRVWWQGLFMLFPIAYLFFDLFVFFNPTFYATNSAGQSYLSMLFEKLSSVEFSDNTFAELTEATLGTETTVFSSFSLGSLISDLIEGGGVQVAIVPIAIVVIFALFSAEMGFILLISGGRILNARPAVDLCLFAGVGAAFSPLLALFVLRICYCIFNGFAAADAIMLTITPSIECILLMLLLMLTLLPAMASIREIGAYTKRKKQHLTFPFRFAEKMTFPRAKTFLRVTVILAVLLALTYSFLPVTTKGSLISLCAAWESFLPNLQAVAAGEVPDFMALSGALETVFLFLPIPLLLISLILMIIAFVRVCKMKEETLGENEKDQKRLLKIGKRVREMILTPYACLIVFAVSLTAIFLFASPVAAHINFGDVGNSIGVFYLTLAKVRSLCGMTTVFTLLALGGAFLWHATKNAAYSLLLKVKTKNGK